MSGVVEPFSDAISLVQENQHKNKVTPDQQQPDAGKRLLYKLNITT